MKTYLTCHETVLTVVAAAALLAACGGGNTLDDASEDSAVSEPSTFAPAPDSTRPQGKAINPGAQLALPQEEIEQ